jgi:hypothetical protein
MLFVIQSGEMLVRQWQSPCPINRAGSRLDIDQIGENGGKIIRFDAMLRYQIYFFAQ